MIWSSPSSPSSIIAVAAQPRCLPPLSAAAPPPPWSPPSSTGGRNCAQPASATRSSAALLIEPHVVDREVELHARVDREHHRHRHRRIERRRLAPPFLAKIRELNRVVGPVCGELDGGAVEVLALHPH